MNSQVKIFSVYQTNQVELWIIFVSYFSVYRITTKCYKKSLRFSDVFRDNDKRMSLKRFIWTCFMQLTFASEKWLSQSQALS